MNEREALSRLIEFATSRDGGVPPELIEAVEVAGRFQRTLPREAPRPPAPARNGHADAVLHPVAVDREPAPVDPYLAWLVGNPPPR